MSAHHQILSASAPLPQIRPAHLAELKAGYDREASLVSDKIDLLINELETLSASLSDENFKSELAQHAARTRQTRPASQAIQAHQRQLQYVGRAQKLVESACPYGGLERPYPAVFIGEGEGAVQSQLRELNVGMFTMIATHLLTEGHFEAFQQLRGELLERGIFEENSEDWEAFPFRTGGRAGARDEASNFIADSWLACAQALHKLLRCCSGGGEGVEVGEEGGGSCGTGTADIVKVKDRDLAPVLSYVVEVKRRTRPPWSSDLWNLDFEVFVARYLQMLATPGMKLEALCYARDKLAPFLQQRGKEVGRLMALATVASMAELETELKKRLETVRVLLQRVYVASEEVPHLAARGASCVIPPAVEATGKSLKRRREDDEEGATHVSGCCGSSTDDWVDEEDLLPPISRLSAVPPHPLVLPAGAPSSDLGAAGAGAGQAGDRDASDHSDGAASATISPWDEVCTRNYDVVDAENHWATRVRSVGHFRVHLHAPERGTLPQQSTDVQDIFYPASLPSSSAAAGPDGGGRVVVIPRVRHDANQNLSTEAEIAETEALLRAPVVPPSVDPGGAHAAAGLFGPRLDPVVGNVAAAVPDAPGVGGRVCLASSARPNPNRPYSPREDRHGTGRRDVTTQARQQSAAAGFRSDSMEIDEEGGCSVESALASYYLREGDALADDVPPFYGLAQPMLRDTEPRGGVSRASRRRSRSKERLNASVEYPPSLSSDHFRAQARCIREIACARAARRRGRELRHCRERPPFRCWTDGDLWNKAETERPESDPASSSYALAATGAKRRMLLRPAAAPEGRLQSVYVPIAHRLVADHEDQDVAGRGGGGGPASALLGANRRVLAPGSTGRGADVDKKMGPEEKGLLEDADNAEKESAKLPFVGEVDAPQHVRLTTNVRQHLPRESLLSVTLAAGRIALPKLLQYRELLGISAGTSSANGASVVGDTLPIELDLPPRFWYHSNFVCPVSRTFTAEPYLLGCGHVISKQCMDRLARNSRRTFKCPICPAQQTAAQAKRLYFPPEM